MGETQLLERESALSQIDSLLESVLDGDGRALMIDGEAGTGKSALVRHACERAADAGFVVLRARGGALEQDFGFGVARQLFEPELDRVSRSRAAKLFAGAAELAGPVIGHAARSAGSAGLALDSTLAAQHGLYWLTANMASTSPLLICVDDVHWADRASVSWLLYLLRRLEGLRVGVIVATRIGEPAAAADLRSMRLEAQTSALVLEPLTRVSSDVLVIDAFGAESDDAFRAACHDITGGNPFYLRELVSAAADEGIAPTAATIRTIEELGRDRASGQILLRLERLGVDAVMLARSVAVLGTGATARRAGLLSGLPVDRVRQAVDALVSGRVLAAGDSVDFVHPLVRAAVYEDLPAAERGAMHLIAARLLDDDGASDEAAVHLLAAERTGDAWVVECLLGAGRRDRDRGGGHSAVRLLRRALDEPPAQARRAAVLLELGRAERLIADGAALEHLEAARALATGPEEIEAATHELAYLLGLSGEIEKGAAVLEAAIDDLASLDRAAAERLEVDLISLLLNHDDTFTRGAERLARVLPAVAEDTAVYCALKGLETWARFESGQDTVAEMESAALRALEGTTLLDQFGPDALPVQASIAALTRCDRLDLSTPLLESVLEQSRKRGSMWGIAMTHGMRCQDAYWVGDARVLEQEAEAAIEFAMLAGAPIAFAAGLTCTVVAHVHQGRYDDADELLTTYGFAEVQPPPLVLARLILLARSRLRTAQGRHEEAVADALGALARDRARHPGSLSLYSLPEAAAALHAAGEHEQALVIAREYLAAATQWGSRSEMGRATRVLGVIEGSTEGLRLLAEAAELLAPTPRRLEYTLALIDLGVSLRRSGEPSQSREPLLAGMEIAHRCGADAEVERARAELGAAGARPRALVRSGLASLTAAERRVADLAAAGRNNPGIAQALFLSRRTVEAHLRSIFRKLDIRSRDDLPASLQELQPET